MFLTLVAIGSSFVIGYCSMHVRYLIGRTENDEFYANLLNGTEWMVDGKIPYFGAFPLTVFSSYGGIYISFALVIVPYLLVAFCSFAIYRHLRKSSPQFDGPMKKYQKQITIVMAVEVCTQPLGLVRGSETSYMLRG